MAGYGGPRAVDNSLVFGYDTGRNPSSGFDHKNRARRFFKGKNTSNVVTNTNLDTGWSKGYNTSIQTNDYPPPRGIDSQVYSFIDADGNGSGYWYSYGDYAPQDPSTTYTISLWVRTIGSDFAFRAYTANNSEVGRQSTNTITIPGDGKWHRAVFNSITTPSNTQSDSLSFQFITFPANQRVWICAPQMEVGSIATPFVDGTRSSTNSIIDLTRTTNIDVSNVSFGSDGLPTFDGTDDRIVSDAILVEGSQTFETVFMATENPHSPAGILTNHQYTSPQANFGINYVSNSGFKLGASIGYTDGSREYDDKRTTYVVQQDVAIHAVLTYDETNNRIKWYINGELDSTHNLSKTPNFESIPVCSGRWTAAYNNYYFDGYVYLGKIYNKELSADEVQQNYNTYKNRFGL